MVCHGMEWHGMAWLGMEQIQSLLSELAKSIASLVLNDEHIHQHVDSVPSVSFAMLSFSAGYLSIF